MKQKACASTYKLINFLNDSPNKKTASFLYLNTFKRIVCILTETIRVTDIQHKSEHKKVLNEG